MNVEFADSFGKSIKRLIREQSWWYKTYDTIRYKIPMFFRNIWLFRRALWEFRWWDYRFVLPFLKTSIDHMYPLFEEKGLEVDESRLKKVDKMKRVSHLLNNFLEDNFVEQAESELGNMIHYEWEFEDVPGQPGFSRLVDKETEEEKEHNRKILHRSGEIEEQQWNELWTILRGTKSSKKRNKKFDGSDLRAWWD